MLTHEDGFVQNNFLSIVWYGLSWLCPKHHSYSFPFADCNVPAEIQEALDCRISVTHPEALIYNMHGLVCPLSEEGCFPSEGLEACPRQQFLPEPDPELRVSIP